MFCEALTLALNHGWGDEFYRSLFTRRLRGQVEAIVQLLKTEQALGSVENVDKLLIALKTALVLRKTERKKLLSNTIAIDPLEIEESLAKYHDVISPLPKAIQNFIDAYLCDVQHEYFIGGPIGSKDDVRLQLSTQRMHKYGLIGLALSGGGIRSASFCIGVLQSMGASGLLTAINFISAVSGGGYAASWLSAWAYRHREGIKGVQDDIRNHGSRDSGPLRWVRRYGSYLSPRQGLLAPDLWGLVVAYISNWVPIFVFVFSAIGAMMLIPHALVEGVEYITRKTTDTAAIRRIFIAGTVLGAVGLAAFFRSLTLHSSPKSQDRPSPIIPIVVVASSLTLGLMLTAAAPLLLPRFELVFQSFTLSYFNEEIDDRLLSTMFFWTTVYLAAFVVGICFDWIKEYLACRTKPQLNYQTKRSIRNFLALLAGSLVAGVTGGLFIDMALTVAGSSSTELVVTLGPISVVTVLGLAELTFVLFTERYQSDIVRSRSARVGGWMLIAAGCWTLVCFFSLTVPSNIHLSGRSAYSFAIVVAIFVALFLLAKKYKEIAPLAIALSAILILVAYACLFVGPAVDLVGRDSGNVWREAVALGLFALLIGRLTNVNRFSLHSIYKDALVRTFLGASRLDVRNLNVSEPADIPELGDPSEVRTRNAQYKRRRPDALTDFDDEDNPAFGWLKPAATRQLPILLLNAAVNGKADDDSEGRVPRQFPYTFSALYSGSAASGIGYAKTDLFFRKTSDNVGLTLGTAMAVSGAAVSPTSGRSTDPLRAFLLGLMNARLGLWIGNPSRGSVEKETPRLGGLTMLQELLGIRTIFKRWIHLSDGGHFENLGVYELVRRGCRRIIAVDASCDPQRNFSDLANTIRRVQIDLGVSIRRTEPWGKDAEFDLGHPELNGLNNQRAWTWFEIDYGTDVKGRVLPKGRMLYLKPSVEGIVQSSVSVVNYKRAAVNFPHESTSDQFFTEQQLEAYRSLGFDSASHAFEHILGDFEEATPQQDAVLATFMRRRFVRSSQ